MAMVAPLSLKISLSCYVESSTNNPLKSKTSTNFRTSKSTTKSLSITASASLQHTPTQSLTSETTTIQSQFSGGLNNSLCRNEQLKEAMQSLDRLRQQAIPLNTETYASILQACNDMKDLEEGKQLHGNMLKSGIYQNFYLKTKLLTVYVKCGCLEEARLVFDSMRKPNMFSWTTMIKAYTLFGNFEESIESYNRMRYAAFRPDIFVLVNVLKACGTLEELQQGKRIHSYVISSGFESDVVLEDALVDMYVKCGSLEDAHQVFNKLPQRDVVSWNVMISGYAYNGLSAEALKIFSEMRLARVRPNLKTWNTLIDAYSNGGNCDEAYSLLRQMQLSGAVPNVISWNIVLGGYARKGHGQESLRLFRQMIMAGEQPNSDTIGIVLSLCPCLEDPQHVKDLHGYIIRNGLLADAFVGNALVDMYVKIGSIEDARQVFDEVFDRDEVLWNSMIAGYTQNGHADEELRLDDKIEEEEANFNPMT